MDFYVWVDQFVDKVNLIYIYISFKFFFLSECLVHTSNFVPPYSTIFMAFNVRLLEMTNMHDD